MGNMNLDRLMVSAIRSLSIDMVENANTGHLGMPLGSAPMTYALYKKHLEMLILRILNGLIEID